MIKVSPGRRENFMIDSYGGSTKAFFGGKEFFIKVCYMVVKRIMNGLTSVDSYGKGRFSKNIYKNNL